MSDDPTPKAKPLPADAKQSAGQTPGLQPQTTVPAPPPPPPPAGTNPGFVATGTAAPTTAPTPPKPAVPVIEYTMPEPKTSWLPTPTLIRNIGCLIKLIMGFTVLLCLGYFALVALNPKARKWALQGTKPGPGGAPPTGQGPTPFKVINQILAIPAQALGKTDDVVKANNARVGQLDGLVAEEEAKTKGGKPGRAFAPVTDPFASPAATEKKPDLAATGAAAAESAESQAVSRAAILALAEKNTAAAPPPPIRPAVVAPAAPDTPEQMKLAGDIVIAHASPAGSPRASAAFFYWVVKLNVSGVTVSKPARAFINNRVAYEGDEVNRTLGVVFAQLDPANKLLIFRDQSGAVVTRSY